MRKILFALFISVATLGAYAQDYKDSDYYYYDGIENYDEVTSEQKRKIISIKKTIGKRHAAIGKSGLRGSAKGEAHRKLNQEIRKEIYDVLNSNQRDSWDKDRRNSSKDRNHSYKDRDKRYKKDRRVEDRIEAIEDEIDRLEDYYDDLIDKVEDDDRLSKSVRKARKKQLENEFKTKKTELKRQKQALKDSSVRV